MRGGLDLTNHVNIDPSELEHNVTSSLEIGLVVVVASSSSELSLFRFI